MTNNQRAVVGTSAVDLLQQGTRCAQLGLAEQAHLLFSEVWRLAERQDPILASTAAWNLAILQLQATDYPRAADWLERVVAQPDPRHQLWPATASELARLCRAHGQAPPTKPALLPALRIHSLGCFRVARGDEELPACRARKALAVLRYLLTRQQRSAHREELMELLWPDATPAKARHSLHVAVGTLRSYLDQASGASYLVFQDERYTLNPGAPLHDDRDEFQRWSDMGDKGWRLEDRPAAEAAYSRAIACYGGDYLVDDQDQAWALVERERLLARYLLALDRLGRLGIARHHFELALECFHQLVARDEFREDAHCNLMRCYLQLGRRGEALRQYERCATVLARELGLEPLPETQALFQQILNSPNLTG